MPASPATLFLPSHRPHWPAVLLCCLLSVLAPFAESTVLQVIEASASQTGDELSERDDLEDEEDLIRVRDLNDSWRAERQQAFFLSWEIFSTSPDPRLTPFSARRSQPHHSGPGSEHAYRNGFGGPLHC